ncbi:MULTISPECIES: helix-turn-helix domain-containing protein [Aeromonas]|uniref:helix-turn-helix domain-containing protein n=1 Tax=Aeromonas TaxID=642 RepID=UPI00051BD7A7|nr:MULTISPECIES: helix-turn-helix domain-containing protein [Aeromonas]MCH7373190.1 AraC family transcriptional regulator [Aeromonas sp. MR16]
MTSAPPVLPGPVPQARSHFTRIERVLDYIHAHLDEPLSLEQLAEQSCWSRWQLQRVFLHETGLTVAHYVRELKLSQAAEALLSSRQRVLDLALCYGFGSEVSFSRAFKQQFGCSPLAYRKRGQRLGLSMPLVRAQTPQACAPKWVQVRVESRAGFVLHGIKGEIRGLFANEPDFHQTVPAIWRAAQAAGGLPSTGELLGVVDVSAAGAALPYWAGVAATEDAILPAGFARLTIPSQEYAVLSHVGPIQQLAETLNWFILHWLPGSCYRGLDGFELERYGPHFNGQQADARMEYWLPVAPCEAI